MLVIICVWVRCVSDIDECVDRACDPNAECMDTDGAYVCQCNTGYAGDGKTCSGILILSYYLIIISLFIICHLKGLKSA